MNRSPFIILPGFLVLLCSTLAGVATVTDTATGRVVANPTKGFTITFPKMWTVRESDGAVPLLATSPLDDPNDTFREKLNIIVQDFPKAPSLEDYSKTFIDDITKNSEAFTILKVVDGAIDGAPAKALCYTCTSQHVGLQNLSYLIAKDTRVYAITCTATPETYAQYKAVFQGIVLSFKFGVPAPSAPTRIVWKEQGFSLIPPANWKMSEEEWPKIPGKVVSLTRQKANDGEQANEVIYIYHDDLPDTMSVTGYLQRNKKSLKQTLPKFTEIGSGDLTIDKQPVKWLAYSCTTNEMPLFMTRFVLVDGKRGYAITCTTTPEGYSKYNDVFIKTVQTFQLVKADPPVADPPKTDVAK